MTRRGVVLGAGGVLGFSWAVGALTALQESEGFDVRDAEVIVGTSAGSVTAALLGCGVTVDVMLRHQQGIPAPGDPVISYDEGADGAGPLPPLPSLGVGSTQLLRHAALHPRTVTPMAALSSMLPVGRATLDPIRAVVETVLQAGESAPGGAASGDAGGMDSPAWAGHAATWIVAMDYDSGRRVPFGAPGAPSARLPDAVAASCAIPGWFAPVAIGERRYVDGGMCSTTSLDLLAGLGLDEVYVVAPMASFAYDEATGVAARLERRLRRAVTRRLMREAEKVRVGGTHVTMLGPGPEDLAAIGGNMMDPSRRQTVLETSLRTSARALQHGGDPYPVDESLAHPHDDTLEDDLDGALTLFTEDDGDDASSQSSGRAS
jgi:NTE family protein